MLTGQKQDLIDLMARVAINEFIQGKPFSISTITSQSGIDSGINYPFQDLNKLSSLKQELQLNLQSYYAGELTQQGLIQTVKDMMRNSWNAIKSLKNIFNTKEAALINFSPKGLNKITKNALNGKYGALSDTHIPTPAGLSVGLLDYVTVVKRGGEEMMGLDSFIDLFRQKLGAVVSNPEGLRNPEAFNADMFKAECAKMTAWKEALAPMVNPNDNVSTKPFCEIYKNTTEFVDTVNLNKESVGITNKISRKSIQQNIDSLNVYFDSIEKQAGKEGFSKQVVAEIADGAFAVASTVEAFSALIFVQRMVSNTLSESVEIAAEIL